MTESDDTPNILQLASDIVQANQGEAVMLAAFGQTEGTYNTLFRGSTTKWGDFVFKLSPPSNRGCLTYESDLMQNEIAFLKVAGSRNIPVARMLAQGKHHGRRWLATELIDGQPLSSVRERMSVRGADYLDAQIGRAVGELHQIHSLRFGYLHQQALQSDSWLGAFTTMLRAVLDDAVRWGAVLPVNGARLLELPFQPILQFDQIKQASLVHFDLWDGNLLVHPMTHQLMAFVDHERCFYGDPLAEFASLCLFSTPDARPSLVAAYERVTAMCLSDPPASARLHIYQLYLYLIMLVEATPRGTVNQSVQQWLGQLIRDLYEGLSDSDLRPT